MRRAHADVDLPRLQVIQSFEHQAERPPGESAAAALAFAEEVRLQHRHGAAQNHHRGIDGLERGVQVLMLEAEFVERIAHQSYKELTTDSGKEVLIACTTGRHDASISTVYTGVTPPVE